MPLLRNAECCIINDDDFQSNAVLDTGIPDTAIGQLWGIEVNSGYQGLYFVSKGTFTAIAASPYLSGVKDTAGKINFYFEGGTLKAQNKLATTRYLYVKFEGLS